MKIDPDGRLMYNWDFNWFYNFNKRYLSRLYRKQNRLTNRMNNQNVSSNRLGKLQGKFNQNNDIIQRVKEDMNNLELMKNDPNHTYVMTHVSATNNNGRLGSYLNDNGIIEVQYSTKGNAAHERAHVGQSISTNNMSFDEQNYLNNAAWHEDSNQTREQVFQMYKQMTMNEVEAYRIQYAFDGRYRLPGIHGYINIDRMYDMNPHTLANIIYKGELLYPFASRYIKELNNK